MEYLLKLSLGPVQDFIAAARKLEDLWAGSLILSNLMQQALDILGGNSAEIIYPKIEKSKTGEPDSLNANLPNIVVCRFADKEYTPAELANKVEAGVKEKFKTVIETELHNALKDDQEKFFDEYIDKYIDKYIKDQTAHFLDMNWAAVPEEESIGELGKLFDAAKRTRQFRQLKQPGLKCTLQTDLSALAPRTGAKDSEVGNFWRSNLGNFFISKACKAVRSKKGERFSSIGLAKRLYRRGENGVSPFPSTYSIATAQWRANLSGLLGKDDKLNTAYDKFYKKVKDLSKDTDYDINKTAPEALVGLAEHIAKTGRGNSLLSWEPQCLTETEPKDPSIDFIKDPLAELRANLIKQATEKGLGPPPRHFALLLADGDSMGRIVDAQPLEKLPDLSRALSGFAQEAAKKVQDAFGRMIYMGGDDLMAVAPVEKSLDVACAWREDYLESIKEYKTEDQKEATLSVALLLAPVDYPLNRLLPQAHAALESQAKDQDKDALAIHVYKGDTLAADVVLPTKGTDWQLTDWSSTGREILTKQKLSSTSFYALSKDQARLKQVTAPDKPAEHWNLANTIAVARLLNAGQLNSKDQEALKKWAGAFTKALDELKRNRFLRPDTMGKTLMALHKMWAMWGAA